MAMIQETLKKVASGQDLTYDEAYASMDEIFSGQVPGETTAVPSDTLVRTHY